jgi:hypothetical protein
LGFIIIRVVYSRAVTWAQPSLHIWPVEFVWGEKQNRGWCQPSGAATQRRTNDITCELRKDACVGTAALLTLSLSRHLGFKASSSCSSRPILREFVFAPT